MQINNGIAYNQFENSDGAITLMNLFQLLIRYKFLVITTFIIIFSGAMLYVLFSPKKYNYSREVEIGTYINAYGTFNKIEKPAEIVADVTHFYLPISLAQAAAQNKINHHALVSVSNPDDSDAILFEAKGKASDADYYNLLFQLMLDNLIQKQQYLFAQKQAIINTRLTALKQELANRKNDAEIMDPKSTKTTTITTLQSLADHNSPIQIVLSSPTAQLRADANIQQIYLSNLRPTHFGGPFLRSPNPVGLKNNIFMATILVAMFAFMCALFSAFLAHASVRIRDAYHTFNNSVGKR